MSFAFGCHMQVVPIYGELTDSRIHIPLFSLRVTYVTFVDIPRRPNIMIICTNLVCIVLYSLTGIFGKFHFLRLYYRAYFNLGYLEFGEHTEGNILKNYSDHDVLVNIARAALCFVIVCHYPPSNYCCRFIASSLSLLFTHSLQY